MAEDHTKATITSYQTVADFEDELSRHHRAAFGWALACCRWDRSAAEDVLQTAYLRILDGHARYGGRATFRAFLFGVVRRTAQEERRRHALRALIPLRAAHRADDAVQNAGNSWLDGDDDSKELVAALSKLSARQREILHLVFYSDMTIAEAGAVMGIGIGSARVHYERGKQALRRLLGSRRD